MGSITSFLRKSRRVWQVLRKPDREEVSMVAKVSAVGILAIGLIGFLIGVTMTLLIS